MIEPQYGWTRNGQPVHAKVVNHLPSSHRAAQFNSWLAVKITSMVGSMWCAYVFCGIALTSLPSTLALHSIIADVQWIAQTFLQLVLLSVIIVGQNIQSAASDARAAKTFEDTEVIVDRLDERTQGGIRTVLDAIDALPGKIGGTGTS